LAIGLWLECCNEQQFHTHLPEQMFLEVHHKLGISITNNKLWHAIMFIHISKNNLAESKVVAIILVGTILANLDN
jgi:hypothetical protein